MVGVRELVRLPGYRTVALAAGLAAAFVVGVAPGAAHAQTAGAASPTDLDFVARVHLTAVSVSPASATAQGVSASAGVKGMAKKVGTQDSRLDDLAVSTAKTLKVSLAAPPSATQQAALTQLQGLTGGAFDSGYVSYLWNADSALLPIATTVRATTRNASVRKLATQANDVMTAQLPLLQNSGLLRLSAPASSTAVVAKKLPGGATLNSKMMSEAQSGNGFMLKNLQMRLLVLAAALIVGGVLFWRMRARSLPSRRRRRGTP